MHTPSEPTKPLKPIPPSGISSASTNSPLAKLIAETLNRPVVKSIPAPLGQSADDPPLPSSIRVEQAQPAVELPEDERPSRARLQGFANTIAGRVSDIKEIFGDAEYSPLKNKDFKKFLGDQVAEVAMRYVRVGVVHSEDADAITPDERERRMTAKGFTVGEAEKAKTDAVKKATDAADEGGATTSVGHFDEHDTRFMSSPAVQQARALGFDPESED